jgi:ABC-type transport system involved in multi-copper enzyme maturation permease subunit
MRQILGDLRRAIFSRSFLIAFGGMTLCLCIGVFSNALGVFRMEQPEVMYGYHNELLLSALSSDIILFAVPILAAIPYTTAFTDDVRSGYLKPYLTRTSVSRYILGKGLGAAISGGLALVLGILLAQGIFLLVFSPIEVYGEWAVESRIPDIILRLFLFFLSGAMWASVGLLASSLTQNVYLAYAAPFIFYYVLIILQERYFRTTFMLNPKNYLTMQGAWPLQGKSAALTLLMLVLILQLVFYMTAQKELRDDKRQKRHYGAQNLSLKILQKRLDRAKPKKVRRQNPVLYTLAQIFAVVRYNFRMWRRNVRIILTFALAFIMCFLLSDKAASFAYEMGTAMQAFEPFVWTFGDANSVLLISLLLVLLFADIPFLGAGVPYYLVRMKRSTWAWGQLIYLILATLIYMLFIFLATTLICMQNSFFGNMWSETAAILGYSGAGKAVALPALVKTLEMSRPFQCAATIFLLMLLYTLVLALLMLLMKLLRGKSAGVVAAFAFSLYGLLLNPELIKQMFNLPDELMYKANVAVGWLSPLNQATYHMHNFGYDLLPRLWQTYLIFGGIIVLLMVGILLAIRKYNFMFLGTEQS